LKGKRCKPKGYIIYSIKQLQKISQISQKFPIQVQEASRTPNRLDQNRPSPWNTIIKTNKHRDQRMSQTVKKKKKTYKCKPIKITAGFSTEILKSRKAWREVFRALNENNFNPRIFYSSTHCSKLIEQYKSSMINESKTVYNHKTTITEDSTKNSAHRR
jgi:hypothetical protein